MIARARLLAAAGLALALLPPSARATGTHNMVRAALVYGPQTPHVGDVWHVSAALESADGLVHPGRRVRVIGEMTGHPMRPIEAEMTRLDDAGRLFSGQLSFTMRGPWRVTLHIEDVNEQLVGAFPLEVAKDDEPAGAEMRTVVWIVPPPQPNVIPPVWAVAGTVALTIAFEIAAAAYHRRRLRRRAATARAAIA